MSSRSKSYRQLTPTGTHQDFLLGISSLQAEGKRWLLTSTWTTWAQIRASWFRTALTPAPGITVWRSRVTISHLPGV